MQEKRRIFCVITQGELGGAQRFVAALANQLDPARFQLHVVWGADSGMALARQLPAHVTTGIARHLVRPVRPTADLAAVRELRGMMRSWAPDVVLLCSSKAGFVGARAAHGLRKQFPELRVVYRIGGWAFNDPVAAWKRHLYLWMEKLSARWKDVIVVNNTHDLDQAHMLGIRPRGKVLRIHNGLDPYLPLVDRPAARAYLNGRVPEEYRHVPYDFLVGTVANFYPAKDLATLIRAAARVSDNVRFVIIGDGPGRADLERLIAQYDLGRRVFLLGRLTDAAKYLGALDVFVLPSAKEGFPWAVLEAMAAKVPVVATRVGAIPEMLEDHAGLIVEPRAPDRLAAALVELLGSARARQELAIRAHQMVITRFSLREMVAQYEKLFS